MGQIAGPASSIVSGGLQVAGALAQGRAQKIQGQIQAIRSTTDVAAAKTRGTEIAASYAEDLNGTLANFMSITAAQNRSVDSATSRALLDKIDDVSRRQRLLAVGNENIRAISAQADGDAALRMSRTAMTSALLRGLPGAVTAAQGAYRFGNL